MVNPTKSLLASIGYAWQGARYFFTSQRNARVQGVAALAALMLAGAVRLSRLEWIALVIVITVVLVAEITNTALEALTDLVCLELHPLVRATKDLAAAAVGLAAVAALVVGGLLFLPHFASLRLPAR